MHIFRTGIGISAVTAAIVVGTLAQAPAFAATPVSPGTAATAAPSSTATPTASATATTPTTAASPVASPTASASASASASGAPSAAATPSTGTTIGANPSIATQNAAGDHAMGSAAADAGSLTTPATTTTTPKFRSLAVAASGPSSAYVAGFDVSAWQPNSGIDWAGMVNGGARFVYIKATENTTYTSSQFAAQWAGASNAGLYRGAYVFATPDKASGAATAQYFLAHGGGWSADGKTLPPLLDIENNPYGATCYGKSTSDMVNWIQDFSSTMLLLTGRAPAIYTNISWWKTCTGNSAAFSKNPYMPAYWPTSGYTSPGTLGASWSTWTMWQWADAGGFPGDQDVFNGDLAALAVYARGSGTPITPDLPAGSANVTTTVTTGSTLGSGQSIWSANQQYQLAMQSDGNLVEYWSGRPLWQSGTSGVSGARLSMQADGNLVIYSPSNVPIWWTATSGNGSTLTLGLDGNIRVQIGSTPIWTSNTPLVDTLQNDVTLTAGQYIHGTANLQQAIMQTDGNFVVYLYGKPRWATGTNGHPGSRLVMQADGNLVLYSPTNQPLWYTSTGGTGQGTHLVQQSDGNMVLYNGNTPLFASWTF